MTEPMEKYLMILYDIGNGKGDMHYFKERQRKELKSEVAKFR